MGAVGKQAFDENMIVFEGTRESVVFDGILRNFPGEVWPRKILGTIQRKPSGIFERAGWFFRFRYRYR